MGDRPCKNSCKFDSVQAALTDFAEGKFLIVMDNENRENEGDLIIAAEHSTPEKMAFLIRHTSGFVCCAATPGRLAQLDLPLMYPSASDAFKTAFCITVDLIEGTTTGISASDRSKTVRAMADELITDPSLFYRPGHVVLLQVVPGGVLVRPGHTEAAVDLCRLTNCSPCGVLCELVNDDGTMKRRDDCFQFSKEHGIKIITIEQLIEYRNNLSADCGRM